MTHKARTTERINGYRSFWAYFADKSVIVALGALVVGTLRVLDNWRAPSGRLASTAITSACGRARGRRGAQEDVCAIIPSRGGSAIMGLFDGHDGDEASTNAARALVNAFSSTSLTMDRIETPEWMRKAIAQLDDEVCRSAVSGGTTAVVAASDANGYSIAHVGDSAAYVCSVKQKSGEFIATRLTEDHGTGNRREIDRLEKLGVSVVESRGKLRVEGELLVTRALGGASYKELGIIASPEVQFRHWKASDVGLILVSDGVTEKMSASDACTFVFGGDHTCKQTVAESVIALGGETSAESSDDATDAWNRVELVGKSQLMRERIERALKCALELGSTDNVALAAMSRASSDGAFSSSSYQRKPSELMAEIPGLGSQVASYEITQMVAWSSGPYVPAEIPFQYDAYDELPTGNYFEQSAIEGALAALALGPGTEQKSDVSNAITSYVDIADDFDTDDAFDDSKQFARGHFGEVWRAKISSQTSTHAWDCVPAPETTSDVFTSSGVILKRILIGISLDLRLSAEREVYFGRLLCGASAHTARFVHTFEKMSSDTQERWLVFKDEGESLERLVYAPGVSNRAAGLQIVTQSPWWRNVRRQAPANRVLKTILKQTFTAVRDCHAKFGVIHRDIKPANIFVKLDGEIVEARLGDFGSAVDAHSRDHLYGEEGPSTAQETPEYSPPEILFGGLNVERTKKYDMWSLGVLTTELLVLGSPKAFAQISRKTRLALEREMRDVHPKARAVAYRLRAMLELCIIPPDTQVAPLLSWDCTETALMQSFKERDPLGIGFESVWDLRFVRKLLSWDPNDRPSADRALEHAFFREGADAKLGWRCAGESADYEWKSECERACSSECT